MYRFGIYYIVGPSSLPGAPITAEVTLGYALTESWGNWVARAAHVALGPNRSWGWFNYYMGPQPTPSYPSP